MFKYIPDENLKELENYKYNGGAYTSLDNVFNIFWNWSSQFLPRFLAPNMITLMGFSCLILSTIPFFWYGNPMVDNIPNWIYLLQ